MDKTYNNIIVRMPNWLGDAVMATPILTDLRKKFPKASITAMCKYPISSLLIGNPHINEIFSFTSPNEFTYKEMKRGLIARLRQGCYDLGILLPNSFSSAWWFWRGNVRERVGVATNLRSLLLTKSVPMPKQKGQEHLVITFKRVLQVLDIPLSNVGPEIFLTEDEKEATEQLLRQKNIPQNAVVIGVNPCAAYGSAKCWLPERFREVIKRLSDQPNFYILTFGDQANVSLAQKVCEGLPSHVINLAGKTSLRELIALIKRCNVMLTNDSGPMHIAAALKTPLVALFGSTNVDATGPYKWGCVINKKVHCAPCYKRVCSSDFKCMTDISVDEVYNAVIRQLG